MPYPITRRLGEALSRIHESTVSEAVAERAAIAFLDTIGVMIAGRTEPAVALLDRTISAMGSEVDEYGNAALLGATAAHALDFDDVAFGGHISAVLVPAILTVAARLGSSSRDVVLAYVAGYEAWAELASREKTMYHARGLHPTGLLGPVAAAASIATLMRLEPGSVARALSIGASQGAGLLSNFGSMTKPFHAGRAAQSGVLAAFLAANGFSASVDTLEAPNGFLTSFSPEGRCDLDRPLNLETQGFMLGLTAPSIKRYPVCYAGHRAIDAVLDLTREGKPAVKDIERIEIRLSERHSKTLRYDAPVSVSEARFSLEFFVGAAFSRGWVGMKELDDSGIGDAAIRNVMGKVRRVITHELDPQLDGYATYDGATFVLQDGSRLQSQPIYRPKGHAANPIGPKEARRKFEDCMESAGRKSDAAGLFDSITGLAEMRDAPLPEMLKKELFWSRTRAAGPDLAG